jgi:DNA-directed RNA polymerase subunit K/omega
MSDFGWRGGLRPAPSIFLVRSRLSWYDSLLMAEEVETTDEQTPLEDAPLPEVTAPLITDRFLFVDVAAMRAKQLRRGARARLGEHHDPNKDAPIKPERIAMEEVRRGVVQYEVPEFKPRLADPKL